MVPKKQCPVKVRDRTTGKRRLCQGKFDDDNDTYCRIHKGKHSSSTPQVTTAQSLPLTPPPTPPAKTPPAKTPPARTVTPDGKIVQPLDSTPYKTNFKSSPNALIDDRCKVFRNNVNQELTLVKQSCKVKIDELFEELEHAYEYGKKLNEVAEDLKVTKQWNGWLDEMQGSYKSENPLKPQGLFYDILTTAQLLLEPVLDAKHHSFRNLLREKIGQQV